MNRLHRELDDWVEEIRNYLPMLSLQKLKINTLVGNKEYRIKLRILKRLLKSRVTSLSKYIDSLIAQSVETDFQLKTKNKIVSEKLKSEKPPNTTS